ncbi:MAG: S8 family serine peptidase [Gammaproteobacteria bacterium]|jgi:serine protease AprX|nr:S8 family serine peptidase [Gammaproteobacteria bacterium]
MSIKNTLLLLKRSSTGVVYALVLAACAVLVPGQVAVAATPIFGAGLTASLTNADVGETFEVIVSFEGNWPLSSTDIVALRNIGVTGLYFHELPMAGVVGTAEQILEIAELNNVRSIWPNLPLEYDNNGATLLTGVDRMRTESLLRNAIGLPYSGAGIGVLVNDTGVDGTHTDLEYPGHVIQNVAAQTNLHSLDDMLPITYTEDIPNTDIGNSHGTHVAGLISATGARSGGLYEGVAPGAKIIGYGSGAGLFILDTLGGFDYALTHQFELNIRVVANSFGSTSDIGTDFNPDDPTNIATKMLADRGIVPVISAGNSGPGEGTITGNFKKAPWIVTVAAGNKHGNLVDFSSRGVNGNGGTVEVDGEIFTWSDQPTITAPGDSIISTRATPTDALSVLSASSDAESIPTAFLPFYTALSGTSMASPHISGTVALMLEANPGLDWRGVKEILQQTATNIPGRDPWEVGAGYVNVWAAVVEAANRRTDFGDTVNRQREFSANAQFSIAGVNEFAIEFSPIGENEAVEFFVPADISLVAASAVVTENTVALVLTDPDGERFGSSISLPVLGPAIGTSAPGKEGVWTLSVSGIGSISGVGLDPLGLTNGTAVPGTVNAKVKMVRTDGFTGLDDVPGHPAQSFIELAVRERLADGFVDGTYQPDEALLRGDLAEYLVMGSAVRQYRPLDGSDGFDDVGAALLPFAEAVSARGAALKDQAQDDNGVIRTIDNSFDPFGSVNRAELAFSLVQALGLEEFAVNPGAGEVTAEFDGQRVPVQDADQIPEDLRGYVQIALDLKLMNAFFEIEQLPFMAPVLVAHFRPDQAVTRAEYAHAAVNFMDRYGQE